MTIQKFNLATMSLAALLATAGSASAAISSSSSLSNSPTPIEVSAAPQDPGAFFHRLKQMRQRRVKYDQYTTPNPEPVTMSLLGLGGLGLAFARRRKQKLTQDS